jgi:chromosome segregation ATPase
MTKLKHLGTGIFAMAFMLVFSMQAWAQTGKSSAPKSASAAAEAKKNPAQATSKDAKAGSPATVSATPVVQKNPVQVADSPIPQLNNLRQVLLTKKAELQKAQAEGNRSQADMDIMKSKIADLEGQIQPLEAREQRMVNSNTSSVSQPASSTPQRTSSVSGPTSRQETVAYMKQHPQTSTSAPESVQRKATPNEIELKTFKADSPIAELNSMRYDLLQLKVELEAGQAEKRLSQQEINKYATKIATMEADIQKLVPSEQKALKNLNAK